ncbi:MAG TPA: biotin/lipoyl-containing protein, partial [Actinomycetales bacterium]|nr:biotin/lipoyl-containing protein [Actinomycetales bacterium]
KADPNSPGQISAPFAGTVTPTVEVGQQVKDGDTVSMIEAMKMEAAITTPVAGVVERMAVAPVQQVEGGDLVLVVIPQ